MSEFVGETQQVSRESVRDIIENVMRGKIVLPSIQRNYVWKEFHIVQLIDSLIRGYPIGSLLLLPKSEKLQLATKKFQLSQDIQMDEDISEVKYLLDGQQRLTSIAKFLNYDPRIKGYFDLLAILRAFFPQYDIDFKENPIPIGELEEELPLIKLIKILKKDIKKEMPEILEGGRYLTSEVIKGTKTGLSRKAVKNLVEQLNVEDEDLIYQFEEVLSNVFSRIMNFYIPIVTIDKRADLESICRIFESINTTGVPLSAYDLINCKSSALCYTGGSEGIFDYIQTDLMDYAKKNEDFYQFLDFKEQNQSFNRIDSVLRILFRVNKWSAERTWKNVASIRKSEILKEDSLMFFTTWDKVKPLYFKAYEWLREKRLPALISNGLVEMVIFALIVHERIFEHQVALENIKKIVLFEEYNNNSSPATTLKNLLDYLEAYLSRSSYNEVHIPELRYQGFENFSIAPEQILETKKTAKLAKFIIHLMKYEKNGYFNKDLFDVTIDSSKKFDEHHIVPASRRERFGISLEMIDSIANITLLNERSNREQVKDSPHYFDDLEFLHGKEKLDRLLQGNLIPDIQLFKDNAKMFIEKRAENLCRFLKDYFH